MTLFLRIIDAGVDKKARVLREALQGGGARSFEVDPSAFTRVPGSPFAYWVSEKVRKVFTDIAPFETDARTVKQGLATADDFRFVRAWWEVPQSGIDATWCRFAKGGSFSPFYSDVHLVLEWNNSGEVLTAKVVAEHGNAGKRIYNAEYYFRPGITWPRRTDGLSFRIMPKGCIFGDKGPSAFIDGGDHNDLLALCAIMNSTPFGYLVSVQLARTELAQSYEVGIIQQTPVPEISPSDRITIADHARRAWSLKRLLDATKETSHAFLLPQPLLRRVDTFNPSKIDGEMSRIQIKIDDIAFRLYGISGIDRAIIEEWGKNARVSHTARNQTNPEDDEEVDGESVPDEVEAMLSWAVGVVFGRFDINLALGARPLPVEPDPFDRLPTKTIGTVPDGDASTAPCVSILADDIGSPNDIAALVAEVFQRVGVGFGSPETLRRKLSDEFFSGHLKAYSKSRRKAPIYWQIGTISASYSVWLYVHAFTKDTLFRVQNDFVGPRLSHEQRQLETLRTDAGDNPTAFQRNAIEVQSSFVEEILWFFDEVRRVAPLWNPNLDDGVTINFAPLWRLVPHKSWQKELKATWSALVAGAYDWSHLAMHLWPERVVPKCADDRSLSIAHGLEDVFWAQDNNGKWIARESPTRRIKTIVEERTSPAAKAALKSLMEAPDHTGSAKRGRKSKAN